MSLTLERGLAYKKLGITKRYTEKFVGQFAAEVGLLTRNVVIRGSPDTNVPLDLPRCPPDFQPGQFVTQTCVQGNPVDQIGAFQHGGHVHIGGPSIDSGVVHAYIAYTEFFYMGQAFRLGRYPVHFHLNGRMPDSYVRGCSIHNTFNRAINIHNTHELLIEHNVAYNIMGGAFFLEDGIETGNVLQYNLFVYVKKTSSLLNDDVVPAAYWITNPNNTIQHNVAAGGTNFGFWYRMLEHPNGPSTTKTICPRIVPLGKFENNTVHSQGWFALWIHEDFFPTKTGKCGSRNWDRAVFRNLFAWNNDKGPECVNCGSVQFEDMLLVNNMETSVEGKTIERGLFYDAENGPHYKDIYIVTNESALQSNDGSCSSKGITLPWSQGLTISNVIFQGFNGAKCSAIYGTVITCQCSHLCGGFEYRFQNITWIDTDNRAEFRWQGDINLRDVDGSLVRGIPNVQEMPGALIIGAANHLPASKCGPSATGDLGSAFGKGRIEGVRCTPDVAALRLTISQPTPGITVGDFLKVTLVGGGTELIPFKTEGLTEGNGWMTTLINNFTYALTWNQTSEFGNLSYMGHIDIYRENDFVVIRHLNMLNPPDRVRVFHGEKLHTPSNVTIDPATSPNGHVFYNSSGYYLDYIVRAPTPPKVFNRYRLSFSAYKCFFPDCKAPEPEDTTLGTPKRPSNAVFWSKAETWTGDLGPRPVNGSKLIVPENTWLVLDTSVQLILSTIYIKGALELISGTPNVPMTYHLTFKQFVIHGGRFLAGFDPENPLTNANLKLTIVGNAKDPDEFNDIGGPIIGPKAIAVYGQLFLHADHRKPTWTRIRETAEAGTNTLKLQSAVVNWRSGDRIVISTTSKDYLQSEVHIISTISQDKRTLVLSSTLAHRHVGYDETFGGYRFSAGAEVAIMSSNILVEGDATSTNTGFGGRILNSLIISDNNPIVGQLRLSGIHLLHMGQPAYVEPTDARLPVAFIRCGDSHSQSYVNHNIFEESFSHALGVYASDGLTIKGNVFFRTKGSGVVIQGTRNVVERNLIIESRNMMPASLPERPLQTALDLTKATDTVVRHTTVAGSEQICMATVGLVCGTAPVTWQGLVMHSCLIGVVNTAKDVECSRLTDVQIYSTTHFSIFWSTSASILADNLQLVDNKGGLYPLVGKPSGRTGILHSKTYKLRNSLIVGRTSRQSCTDAALAQTLTGSSKLAGAQAPGGGNLGMTVSQFMSSVSDFQKMGFLSWSSEFSLGGGGFISNVTVANFGSSCPGATDVLIRSDPINEDGMQQTFFEDMTLLNVLPGSLVYYSRPKLSNIGFNKCGDLECDGLKKVLITDRDGSIFGTPTVILPQSEWQYNKNPDYGIGDNRIPPRMQVHPDGSGVNVNLKWPQKGIIRNNSCQLVASMQAYKCPNNLEQRILLLQSLDADTLTRRVAPVVIASENAEPNTLDIINGPSDHGQCSSYACMKRLSSFYLVVAQRTSFQVFFTATPPQRLRLKLQHVDKDYTVRVGISYANVARLDIYVDGKYVLPKNGKYDKNGQVITSKPSKPDEFLPSFQLDGAGSNYYDNTKELQYVLLKGSVAIEIRQTQLVKVSFSLPAMTVGEFFASNALKNLAAFLNVPESQIRVANIVAEKRRKRDTNSTSVGIKLEIVIEEPPVASLSRNETEPVDISQNETITPSVTEVVAAKLVTKIQSGTFSVVLNTTVIGILVQQPLPQTGSNVWKELTSNNASFSLKAIKVPASVVAFAAKSAVEGEKFSLRITTIDDLNERLDVLGTEVQPWRITIAGIKGTIMASYTNHQAFPVTMDGWAVLDDIRVSTIGRSVLQISVVSPDNSSVLENILNITTMKREFKMAVQLASFIGAKPQLSFNDRPKFTIFMFDKSTGNISEHLDWRGFTWKLNGRNCASNSSTEIIVDPTKAEYNLTLSPIYVPKRYVYCFGLHPYESNGSVLVSDYGPKEVKLSIRVLPANYVAPQVVVNTNFSFTFDGDIKSIASVIPEVTTAILNKLDSLAPNVTFTNVQLVGGPITFEAEMGGHSPDIIEKAAKDFQSKISSGEFVIKVYDKKIEAKRDSFRADRFNKPSVEPRKSWWKYSYIFVSLLLFIHIH